MPDGSLVVETAGSQTTYTTEQILRRELEAMPREGFLKQHYGPIAAEFCRLAIDSRYPHYKLPKNFCAQTKAYIKAEAIVWEAAFDCLERINTLGAWDFPIPFTHPVLGLFTLVRERQFLNLMCPPSGTTNVNAYIRGRSAENRQLQTGGNPFDAAFTHYFVKKALQLCDRSDRFAEKKWEPLLKARSALTATLSKTEGLTIFSSQTGKPITTRSYKTRKI
jgi:hypothetical protein